MNYILDAEPVPSVAFFHIPLPEMISLADHGAEVVYGNKEEKPCPSEVNSGLYGQFLEMQDVFAVLNGHDHDCDFVLDYGPVTMIYGRYSGGDTVYNHLGINGRSDDKVSGARVLEFKEGEPGFTTWLRLSGGERQHVVDIPCEDAGVGSEEDVAFLFFRTGKLGALFEVGVPGFQGDLDKYTRKGADGSTPADIRSWFSVFEGKVAEVLLTPSISCT